MARKPKKLAPLKVVEEDEPPLQLEIPTSPWFIKADELRLNYWRAVKSGEIASSISTALQAWKDHLHVPRTKRKT